MPRLEIKKNSPITLIEETWWRGELDGKEVAIYAKIFRSDAGARIGKIGALAEIRSVRRGGFMGYGGAPDPEKIHWAATRELAVAEALNQLVLKHEV
jgi:hypothetical protein